MSFKLGVITDVHADLGALQAALGELDDLGVDQIVCAGDIVDGGDQPEQVIALLREREIPCIKGNHDRWAVMRHDNGEPEHEGDGRKLKLRSETVDWLSKLPAKWSRTIEGVRIVVVHGSPRSDMDGIYPDASDADLESWLRRAEADVLIAGHTHVPLERHATGGKLVVNPGALWRATERAGSVMLVVPGGGPSTHAAGARGGCFGVLELPAKRWTAQRLDGTGEQASE